jgi:hypothetical protein
MDFLFLRLDLVVTTLKSILEKTLTPWRYTEHHLSLVKYIYGLVDLDGLDPIF